MLHLWNYAAWFRMYINFFGSYCELNSSIFINSLGAICTGILYSSFNNDFPSMIRCVNTIVQICTYDTWSVLNCQYSTHSKIFFNIFQYAGFHVFYRLLGQQSAICDKKNYILHLVIVLCKPWPKQLSKMTCLLAVRHNVDFKLLAINI